MCCLRRNADERGTVSDPKRVTVWWYDAHGAGDRSIDHNMVVKEHRPLLLAKTGWLVRSDKTGVTLAHEWAPSDERNQPIPVYDYRGTAFVPRGMIKRVEVLHPKKGAR